MITKEQATKLMTVLEDMRALARHDEIHAVGGTALARAKATIQQVDQLMASVRQLAPDEVAQPVVTMWTMDVDGPAVLAVQSDGLDYRSADGRRWMYDQVFQTQELAEDRLTARLATLVADAQENARQLNEAVTQAVDRREAWIQRLKATELPKPIERKYQAVDREQEQEAQLLQIRKTTRTDEHTPTIEHHPGQIMLQEAERCARLKHKGQVRKFAGGPYVDHCERVAHRLLDLWPEDSRLACAGWCHDVIEDCGVTTADLAEYIGRDATQLVQEVTNPPKPKNMPRAERKAVDRQHLAGASIRAVRLKLVDRLDNLQECRRDFRAYDPLAKDADEQARGQFIQWVDVYLGESKLLAEQLDQQIANSGQKTERDWWLLRELQLLIDEMWRELS